MIRDVVSSWLVMLVLAMPFAMVLGVVLAGALVHRALSRRERRRFPPPGELCDVGGYRLHLHRSGSGNPTVVLDSALAGTSLSWFQVAPELARIASVVCYDRAGFGWSEPAPGPRRVDRFVDELHRALDAARIEPPYVLVGHSYGGWIARLFASLHPGEVAGLVLVDVPHPREWMDPTDEQKRRIARGARLARLAGTLASFGVTRLLFRLAAPGLSRASSSEPARISSLLGKVPESLRPALRSFWVRPETLLSLASFIENAPESAARVHAASRPLGDLPLVVLTAAGASAERMRDQEEVARSSSRGRHVVARSSGHWIPLEEPELVIEAVRELVQSTREAQGSAGFVR